MTSLRYHLLFGWNFTRLSVFNWTLSLKLSKYLKRKTWWLRIRYKNRITRTYNIFLDSRGKSSTFFFTFKFLVSSLKLFDNIINSIGGVPLGGLLDGRRSSIYCVTGTWDCHNIRDCILPSWLTWSMFLFQHPVSYDDKEMTLNWHKTNPVTVSESIQIPSYTLSHHRWYSAVEEFTTGERLRFWCLYLDLNHNNNH